MVRDIGLREAALGASVNKRASVYFFHEMAINSIFYELEFKPPRLPLVNVIKKRMIV
jgi:hypothetical protein